MEVTDLEALVDDLIDIDSDSLDDATVHGDVMLLQRITAKLAALRAARTATWCDRKLWASNGSASATGRLAHCANLSAATARSEIRRAHTLRELPGTADALADGDIGVDHVELLAGAAAGGRRTAFLDHEALLVDHCRTLDHDAARDVIDYWKLHVDSDRFESDAARLHANRRVTVTRTDDGAVVIRAVLDPLAAAAVTGELDRVEQHLRRADQHTATSDTGDGVGDGVAPAAAPRTLRQRRADALVEIATRSRTAPAGGVRPRPLLTVLVGTDTLAATCELAAGGVIAPGQLVPLLGDADLEHLVFDGDNRILSASHRRRFTGALRRAIEVRDRHCQHHSGCRAPVTRCDVDHIVAVPDGGVTSQDNGRLLCATHNRRPDRRNAPPHEPDPDIERLTLADYRNLTLRRLTKL